MSKCIFKIEDMNGKTIHINDYVKFDWNLAKKKHYKDYYCIQKRPGSKDIFQVKGFFYSSELCDNVPCFYTTSDEYAHYVDCCEVVENPLEEDCSVFIEY